MVLARPAPLPPAPAAASAEAPAVLDILGMRRRRERGGVAFELEVPALRLEAGRFVALVGESGCGKSTLLDLLALVLEPHAADRFRLAAGDGPPVDAAALWRARDEAGLARLRAEAMGYVLQTGGLLPFLTVRENIALAARIRFGRVEPERVRAIALELGIADKLDVKPAWLSGGQRQRVAIARALVHRPRLILADEPTAAVDGERARRIVGDFRRLAREHGTTIVMVTHDRELVRPLADTVVGFELETVSETLTRSICRPLAAVPRG